MAVKKLSVSLEEELVAWLVERANRSGASVSAVIAEAVESLRQHKARLRVLENLGGPASWDAVEAELRRFTEAVAQAEQQHAPDLAQFATWTSPEARKIRDDEPRRANLKERDEVDYLDASGKPRRLMKRSPTRVNWSKKAVVRKRARKSASR